MCSTGFRRLGFWRGCSTGWQGGEKFLSLGHSPRCGGVTNTYLSAETAACVDAAKGMGTASELSAGQLVCLTSASSTALVVSCLLPIFNLPYGKLLLAPKKLLSAALPLSTFPPARARASSSLSAEPASALLWFLSADDGWDRQREGFF